MAGKQAHGISIFFGDEINFQTHSLSSLDQMDMHELIEEQMKKQLDDSRSKARKRITTTTAPKKTYSHLLMGLFQR